jgi:hypothetical protein
MMKNTNTLHTENMTQYNGWANYETWRVNLEMLDGMTPEDFGVNIRHLDLDEVDEQVTRLSESMAAYVQEMVEQDAKGFALDLALSFLNEVDWYEIADHMLSDAKAELV